MAEKYTPPKTASSFAGWATRSISKIAAKVAGWKDEFSAKGVAAADIELLAQYLDGDKLRHQREAFLPG